MFNVKVEDDLQLSAFEFQLSDVGLLTLAFDMPRCHETITRIVHAEVG